ncbi:SDR family NAD(P)-dependent oxidoreductase [Ferrovibrio sp.]|uniref:SDR family NAD(P)-dependent oxidoreductase n=1 Tax=Ferrovibrio sp. TaxID=1917215 RepID=UPI000CA9C9F0|nr:SDR family oxidoreductase [Ferrovibrio sp.]PJI38560.1 MAG: dehydrogenase [Ferrovibrio sp.]
MRLAGKVAVVTGAAQGIGRACAERFLKDGAKVVIGDVNEAQLAKTAADLDNPASLATLRTDVSKRADVDALVKLAADRFGRLDVIVNNAGIARTQQFLDITEEDFETVLGINLKGAFFGTQAAARQMIAQGSGGVVINMSSVNALLSIPTLSTYAMSKGAMNQLTTTAAVALAPHNIRVVGIGPGTILTELVAQQIMTSDAARKSVLSRTPIGRCGEPSEVAAVASFLASEDASYVTGQTVYVDGGRMVLNYTVPVKD